MSTDRVVSLSVPAHARAGQWRLHPGHAMTLCPQKTAQLRVRHGRVWVTYAGIEGVAPEAAGDHFLGVGDALTVPAGARLVMEPLAMPGDASPVCFDWHDSALSAAPGRFAREVGAPARDLAAALGQSALALARLLRGLAGYGDVLVAGRGRVLSPLESLRP